MPTLKHGDLEMDWEDIPEISRVALAQRGFTHVFGNEQAATKTRLEKAGKNAAAVAEALLDWKSAKFDAIVDGTLGIRVSSGLDALARTMITIAGGIVRKALKANKIEADDATFAEYVKKYVAKHEATLRVKAEKELTERAEAAKFAAENADEILAGFVE